MKRPPNETVSFKEQIFSYFMFVVVDCVDDDMRTWYPHEQGRNEISVASIRSAQMGQYSASSSLILPSRAISISQRNGNQYVSTLYCVRKYNGRS
jgi:hypothetical protein